MAPWKRVMCIAAVALLALVFRASTGGVFLGSKADADLPRERIAGGEWGAVEEYARARGMMRERAALARVHT